MSLSIWRRQVAAHRRHAHVVEAAFLEAARRRHVGGRQLEQREHLVVAHRRHRDGDTRLLGVTLVEPLGLAEPAQVLAAAHVHRQADPGQVLVRIAQVHEFPVEDGRDVAALLQEVAGAVVAVHDGHARRHRVVALEPTDAPLGQRVGPHRPAFDQAFVELDVALRGVLGGDAVGERGDRLVLPAHAVQRRQRVDEVGAQAAAVAFVQRRLAGRHPGHDGIARDLLAEHEGRAQDGRVVAAPEGARQRHGTAFERLHRHHLRAGTVGCEEAVVGAQAQDQFLRVARPLQAGHRHREGQPGETDREALDAAHGDGMADLAAQVVGHAGGQGGVVADRVHVRGSWWWPLSLTLTTPMRSALRARSRVTEP